MFNDFIHQFYNYGTINKGHYVKWSYNNWRKNTVWYQKISRIQKAISSKLGPAEKHLYFSHQKILNAVKKKNWIQLHYFKLKCII